MQRKKQSIKQQPTQQSTKLSQLEQEKSLQSIQRRWTKSATKQSINEALKAKNNEIDARTDLTDEEKTAAKSRS